MVIEAPDSELMVGKLLGGSFGRRDLRTEGVQGPLVMTRLSHGTATFLEESWYSMRAVGKSESDVGLESSVTSAGL